MKITNLMRITKFFFTLMLLLVIPVTLMGAGIASLELGIATYKDSASFPFPAFKWSHDFNVQHKLYFEYVTERILVIDRLHLFGNEKIHLLLGAEGEVSAADNLTFKIRKGIQIGEDSFEANFVNFSGGIVFLPTKNLQIKIFTQLKQYSFKVSEDVTATNFVLPENFLQSETSLILQTTFRTKKIVSAHYLQASYLARNKDSNWGNPTIQDNYHDFNKGGFKVIYVTDNKIKLTKGLNLKARFTYGYGDNLDDVSRFKIGGDVENYTYRLSGALFAEFFTDEFSLVNLDLLFDLSKSTKLKLYYDALRFSYVGDKSIIEGLSLGVAHKFNNRFSGETRLGYLLRGNRTKQDERYKLYVGFFYIL